MRTGRAFREVQATRPTGRDQERLWGVTLAEEPAMLEPEATVGSVVLEEW